MLTPFVLDRKFYDETTKLLYRFMQGCWQGCILGSFSLTNVFLGIAI